MSHSRLAIAVIWPEVLVLRVAAWVGRGSRQPIKRAIVANATSARNQGRSFGLEPAMDSVGVIPGTASAIGRIAYGGIREFRENFALGLVPGPITVFLFVVLVKDHQTGRAAAHPRKSVPWSGLPPSFRWFLIAEAIFGLGYLYELTIVVGLTEAVDRIRSVS
ncbi:MAG: hypothetical protein ACREEC_03685 [Thermoplasmata archaeon]